VVVFAARPARKKARWRVVGKARTTKTGIARTTTRFKAAGIHQVRVLARKHRNQKTRTLVRKIRITPKKPAKPKQNTNGKAATLFAPERVTTNSEFEIVV